jgi:uncharacterized protein DUF3365
MEKILLIAAALSANPVIADEYQEFTQQSQAAIKEFAGTLKEALVSSMKSSGPVEAINVCNKVAPTIASELSKKYGMEIARTSLKVRNPNNAPDHWEETVLNAFEQRKLEGETVKTLSLSEITTEDGSQEMRMMKAIPTGEVCLICHGSNIAEPIQASLDKLYPDDQATEFSLGDIRGAFTVRENYTP